MPLNDIPAMMYGVQVGTVRINDDGTMFFQLDSPCQMGIDLINEFAAGQHDNLTIVPALTGQATAPLSPVPPEASE